MRNKIITHLQGLEQEENITILFAAESGSRAWGCPSPDSDYDVRIIYKRPKAHYLEIDDRPDTINYFHGKLLDINGWDIKKTLRLIRKSNATPFEWTQSPIIYQEVPGIRDKLLGLCQEYFQPRHAVNHYLGIARNSYLNANEEELIKLKRLFYVLRPIMAAKWILKNKEIPPMDIPNLLRIIDNKEVLEHIQSLLKLKETVDEDYLHKVDPLITKFIANEFENIKTNNKVDLKTEVSSDNLNKAYKQIIEDQH